MTGWVGAIIRFLVSAVVLLVVGALLPGVAITGFTNALIAAVVIALLGYIIEELTDEEVSPEARGLIGFLTSAVVIYTTQFIVANMEFTIIGAALAAVVIGVIDMFIPTKLR